MNRNITGFRRQEQNSEKGLLLLSLCLWIPLWFGLLMASERWISEAHFRMALQARLDICVVKRTMMRKAALQKIVISNEIIRFTVYGVTALRGLTLLTGPLGKLASSMGEAALKKLNQIEGGKQDLLIHMITLKEKIPTCQETRHSNGFVFCESTPPFRSLFHRSSRAQPDLFSPYLAKQSLFGKIRCSATKGESEIRLSGDPKLFQKEIRESYVR